MDNVHARGRRTRSDGRDLIAFHRDRDVVHHLAGLNVQQMRGMDNSLTGRRRGGLLGEQGGGQKQRKKQGKDAIHIGRDYGRELKRKPGIAAGLSFNHWSKAN